MRGAERAAVRAAAGLHEDAAVHLLAGGDEDEPPRVKRSDRIAGRSGGAPACVSLHLQAKQLAARRSSGGGNGGTPFRAPERVRRGCKMGVDGRGVAEGCKQEGGQANCAPHPTGKGAKKAEPTPAHHVAPPPPLTGPAPTRGGGGGFDRRLAAGRRGAAGGGVTIVVGMFAGRRRAGVFACGCGRYLALAHVRASIDAVNTPVSMLAPIQRARPPATTATGTPTIVASDDMWLGVKCVNESYCASS
jgi:hypothetical protein